MAGNTVCRVVVLATAPTADREASLKNVEGLTRVRKNGNRLRVCYEPVSLSYSRILDLLRDKGYQPRDSFWNRARTSWFDYLDSNAKANARHSPACCSRPPPRH